MFFHKTIIAGDTSAREQKSIRYCTRVFSNFVKGRINFRVWCAFMLSAAIFEFEFFTTYCRCSFTSYLHAIQYMYHCAIFRGKNPHKGKALNIQNLPYFWNTKTHVVFFVFHFVLLYFFLNECPGLCRHRPGH